MESNAKYTLVGAFVIGAFVLIVFGVLWLSNRSVTKDVTFYKIYFRNQTLNGLQLSSPVTMKGIKVGVVDKLGISKKSIELVQVTVKLEQGTPIKIDTKATITRNMLTGLAVVELSGGKQDSPDLVEVQNDEEYPIIPEGKSEFDSVAASVPELLRDATEALGQLKEFLGPENAHSLQATLKNTEKFTAVMAAKSDDIGVLISSSAKVVREFEKIGTNIDRFTRPGDGDFAKLNQSLMESAEEVKRQIQAVGDKTSKVASEFSNSFRVIAQDVNTASTSVAQAARSFASTAEHLGDLRTIVRGPDEKNLGPGEKITMRKFTLVPILILLSLTSCSLPFDFSSQPKSYYKLSADLLYDKTYSTRSERIGIRDISADGFVDSHKVLFTAENGEVGYYQFANWVDSPARALTDSLLLGLDRSKLFQFVSRTTSGAVFDYQINGDLIDFSHEAASDKRDVHIVFRAELIDLRSRQVIATKLFELSEPVTQNNVSGAIFGFNLGSQKLLSQVIEWLDSSVPKNSTQEQVKIDQ